MLMRMDGIGLAGVLGAPVIVQASPAATYTTPTGDYTPVYLPNIEYRDHRGLKGEDLKAYNATKARLEQVVAIATRVLAENRPPTGADLIAIRKYGGISFVGPWQSSVVNALNVVNTQLKGLTRGTFAFASFKNPVDGQTWVKYYNEARATVIIKVKPPGSSGWFDWVVDKITDAIVWVKDKIKGFIVDTLCPYLRKPEVQAVLTTGATVGLTAAMTYVGVPLSIAKYIAGIAAAMGVAYLASQCGFPLPVIDSGGGPPQMTVGPFVPQPVKPKYPPGSISRFNTDSGLWVVYAPKKVLSGFGGALLAGPGSSDPVPAVPDGFEKVAEEAGAQNSPPRDTSPQGDERDRRWYDNKLMLGGAAITVIGVVVYATKRRRS